MYKLHAPLLSETNSNIPTVKKLFKEVLGYNEGEINQFVRTKFMCDIAINLSLEQAQKIVKPFYDHEVLIYLYDQANDSFVAWQKDLGIVIPRNTPKSHYYDTPVISREHLVNPYKQQEIERLRNVELNRREQAEQKAVPTIECSYCHSKNTKKISGARRLISVVLFGLASSKVGGKQWHCNSCGSDF